MEVKKKRDESRGRRVRIDKIKNEAKVVKSILKNPLKTQREIAEETWVSKTTVFNKLNNIGQTLSKAPSIEEICKQDIENVKLWQTILNKRLKETPDDLRVNDIVQILAEGTKRYTLFKGNATDSQWWLKSINELPIEELWKRLKALNDKEANDTNRGWENWEGDY